MKKRGEYKPKELNLKKLKAYLKLKGVDTKDGKENIFANYKS